jgi:hypothetical protein
MPEAHVDYNRVNTVFCRKKGCILDFSQHVRLKARKGMTKKKAGEPLLKRCSAPLFPSRCVISEGGSFGLRYEKNISTRID